MTKPLSFLEQSAVDVAPQLLGCILERTINDKVIRVRIVEVEAYAQQDAASHSFKGETPRTATLFGPSGHLYVYFTYGMHYCCNVVTGAQGVGEAVLIRAVEPIDGEDIMMTLRHKTGVQLSNGPAKTCQALGIDATLDGHDLVSTPLVLRQPSNPLRFDIIQTTRIGITKNSEYRWRFYIKNNPYVSHPI